jgi:hypothetical protein
MEKHRNGVEQVTEAASGMRFSDVALRFALWVVYGGEAGELVYRSNSIQEGFGTSSADCASHSSN